MCFGNSIKSLWATQMDHKYSRPRGQHFAKAKSRIFNYNCWTTIDGWKTWKTKMNTNGRQRVTRVIWMWILDGSSTAWISKWIDDPIFDVQMNPVNNLINCHIQIRTVNDVRVTARVLIYIINDRWNAKAHIITWAKAHNNLHVPIILIYMCVCVSVCILVLHVIIEF